MKELPANQCTQAELVSLYALSALSRTEVPAVEAHISECLECQRDLRALRPVIDSLAAWPTELLCPSASLRDRLRQRVSMETDEKPVLLDAPPLRDPEWEEVAPGIHCKFLAAAAEQDRVSMLVRLDPMTEYPPHRHAEIEELHLLNGELWIGDNKLYPGDYNRAEAGTMDRRVWSETGCTCVLVTSSRDLIL